MISESALNNEEAKKELNKIKETEKNVDREKLIYKAKKYKYSFKLFQWDFSVTFSYESRITLKEVDWYQSNLLRKIRNFRDKTRPQGDKKNQEKEVLLKNLK